MTKAQTTKGQMTKGQIPKGQCIKGSKVLRPKGQMPKGYIPKGQSIKGSKGQMAEGPRARVLKVLMAKGQDAKMAKIAGKFFSTDLICSQISMLIPVMKTSMARKKYCSRKPGENKTKLFFI